MTNLPAHYYLSLANVFVQDASWHSSHWQRCGYTSARQPTGQGEKKTTSNQFSRALLEINFGRLVDFNTACIPPYLPWVGKASAVIFLWAHMRSLADCAWEPWAQTSPPILPLFCLISQLWMSRFRVRLQCSVNLEEMSSMRREAAFSTQVSNLAGKSSDSNLAFNFPLLISCCWKATPYLFQTKQLLEGIIYFCLNAVLQGSFFFFFFLRKKVNTVHSQSLLW